MLRIWCLQMQGVGMDLSDPFEQFRKNKSYTFNRRTSSGKLQNRIARYLNSHLNGNINLSLLCLFCSHKVMTIMRYSHANLFTIDEHIFNVHTAWLTSLKGGAECLTHADEVLRVSGVEVGI